MEVLIEEGCIGCGLCASICPDVFEMSDDGLSTVCAEPTEENKDDVREAADSCPVSVIHVED